jgi:hypothetical protein
MVDFRFKSGEPACHGDGSINVSVDRVSETEDHLEHLVTVSAGFPPRKEVVSHLPWTLIDADNDQVCRVGQTDSRGQFWLRRLPESTYALRFAELALQPATIWVRPEFSSQTDSGSLVREAFEADDGSIHACLDLTPDRQLVLHADADVAEAQENPLARFRIWDMENRPVAEGYLGLCSAGNEKRRAEVKLNCITSDFPSRIKCCYLEVIVCPQSELGPSDLRALEASLSATDHPQSQKMLREVIRAVGEEDADGDDEDLLQEIAEMLRAYQTGRSDISAAPLASLSRQRHDSWQFQEAATVGCARASNEHPSALPPQELGTKELRNGVLCVKVPVEKVPYGVARVFAYDADKHLLGTDLLPMPKFRARGTEYRLGEVPLELLVGKRNLMVENIKFTVLPATEKYRAVFLLREIEQLAKTQIVLWDAELAEDIQKLLNLLRAEEDSHDE